MNQTDAGGSSTGPGAATALVRPGATGAGNCGRLSRAAAGALALLLAVSLATRGSGQAISPRPELITPQAEQAIKKGLQFLAGTQARDGCWRTTGGYGAYPTAMTSLAGLALMASGSTPVEGPYAIQVRRAVDYVMSCANPSTGLICQMDEEQRSMHGHGFAMLFLAQAYGVERSPERRDQIRKALQRAVTLTQRSQSRDGGWLYSPDSGGDEGSVTVTQIQGLRAVRNAGIKVPKVVIDNACKYIELSANPDGGIRYQARGGGPSRPPITAAAVATLYNAGAYEHPVAKKALDYIKNLLKNSGGAANAYSGHEYYATLYTGQAMYLSGEENWKSFFPTCRDDLIRKQTSNGAWSGDGVGETYGTAIALLTLQLPYKYLPILQR